MYYIQPISQKDNSKIAEVIRTVLIEHNVPKVGTAYADSSLDSMYETYHQENTCYWVIISEDKVYGGAGIAPLENGPEGVCELQKMYFLDEVRGKGLGAAMMKTCLRFAKEQGFKKCYLETMPNMNEAQKLYKKFGFEYLDAPMGWTGHTSCPVWLLLDLDNFEDTSI
jgi:putative acetyltransferase